MPEKIIVPNPFIFYILTRIIKFEIKEEINKGKSDVIPINEETLKDYLANKGINPSSKSKLNKYLNDIPILCFTRSGVMELMLLANSKFIGNSFEEFNYFMREEIAFYPEIEDYVNRLDLVLPEIDSYMNSFDDNNYRTLENFIKNPYSFEISPELSCLLDDFHQKAGVWLNLVVAETKETIGQFNLMKDELTLIWLVRCLPFGLRVDLIEILTPFWNSGKISLGLLIKRLNRKKVLKFKELAWQISEEVIIPPVQLDKFIIESLRLISDELLKNRAIRKSYEIIYIVQEQGDFELSQKLISSFSDTFKKSGFYKDYADIISRQIESTYFKDYPEPWIYWHLAYSQNMLGNLAQASKSITLLFNYIKEKCYDKSTLNNKNINLFLKAYQLGLEILLNYDDIDVLNNHKSSFALICSEHLQLPRYTKEISPEVKWQILTSFVSYLKLIEYNNYAEKILNNLTDQFIDKEASLIKANINLQRALFFEEKDLGIRIDWAYTAFSYFKLKNNLAGEAFSSIVLASLHDEKIERENYLGNYLNIAREINYYDYRLIDLLKKATIFETKYQDLVDLEKFRLNQIYKKNQSEIGNAVNLYNLINYKTQVMVEEVKLKLSFIDFTNPLSVISEISTPLNRRLESFESNEVQRLMESAIDRRIEFLKRSLHKNQYNAISFFSNSSSKWVMTLSLNRREGHDDIMKLFFNKKLLDGLCKLPNDDLKLDYAHALTRISPVKSKQLIDTISKKNHRYFNLLGNYYRYSKEKDFRSAMYNFENAIRLAEDNIVRFRYMQNLAFTIIMFKKFNELNRAENLFLKVFENKDDDNSRKYSLLGLLVIKLLNIKNNDSRNITKEIDRFFNDFGILIRWRIVILEIILENEDYYKINGYSSVFVILKSYLERV